MNHDEFTVRDVLADQLSDVHKHVFAIYGLRIRSDTNQVLLDEDPGFCLNDGSVGYFRARGMVFLVNQWDRVEYVFHSGIHAVAPKFERDRWNDDLRAVSDRLGLDIVEGPGWFTIPSES